MATAGVCDGPTQLLIAGVAHLTDQSSDQSLKQGFDRLARWQPDVIAIEALPGHLVVEYEARGGAYSAFPVGFAPLARQGASVIDDRSFGSLWQARAVAQNPDSEPADQVLAWLAAREPCNALLAYQPRLDLPPAVHAFLSGLTTHPSERIRIGVRLARQLGHSTVAHIDDHAGVEILEQLPPDWQQVEQRLRPDPAQQPHLARQLSPGEDDAWAKWIHQATDDYQAAEEELNNLVGTVDIDPAGVLRARLAQWRARNLAMAARVRETTASVPGGRVLVIVGSSHQRPLKAALRQDQHDLCLIKLTDLMDRPR